MADGFSISKMWRRAACLAAMLVAAFPTLPAAAEPSTVALMNADPFSALVGERRSRKAEMRHTSVERFAVSSDDRAFLLDGRTGVARLKFLCGENDPRLECWLDPDGPAAEIHIVNATRGPRGDTLFKTAEGEVLLRIASHGGATVFWPGDPQGRAAAQSFSEVESLSLPAADNFDAERRAEAASAALASKSGVRIRFDIGVARPVTLASSELHPGSFAAGADFAAAPAPASETALSDEAAPIAELAPRKVGPDATVLADAIVRVAAGIDDVAKDATGARVLKDRLTLARFRVGRTKSLSLEGQALIVVFDPDAGIDGRVSAAAVARFLEENL